MKKTKYNYTNFILTVIAVSMIGILFKGEKIITSAHAIEKHTHHWKDIIVPTTSVKTGETTRDENIVWLIRNNVQYKCWVMTKTNYGGNMHRGFINCE